jgi:hypothetical protein
LAFISSTIGLPALAFSFLLLVDVGPGAQFGVDERLDPVAPIDLPFGGFEIHALSPDFGAACGRACHLRQVGI